MPIYEYRCPVCKAEYELREGFDAAPAHKCQQCRRGTAKRVLRAPAIVFKGGGFYATDSRRSTGGDGASGDGGSKDGGGKEVAPAASAPAASAPSGETGSSEPGHSHGPGGHSHD